jgi:hypothetical protein
LSALAGWIAEARNAGTRPNKNVTPRVTVKPNPSTRQSAGRTRRAGLSAGLILLTAKCRQTTSHNLLTPGCDVQFCPQNL